MLHPRVIPAPHCYAGLQLGYAGFHVVSRLALNMGISKTVFPVYRNILAFILLPFVYLLEKKDSPPFTWSFILEFFLLAIAGITANQGFYLVGLDNTSPTFASAIQNPVPAITFLMAALLRLEKVRLDRKDGSRRWRGCSSAWQPFTSFLNNFGSYLSNHHDAVYENGSIVGRDASVNGFPLESNQETVRPMDMEGSEAHAAHHHNRTRPTDGGVLQRNQTLGQKIVGNLMDNIFTRSSTLKQKIHTPDASQPSSPSKLGTASIHPDSIVEADSRDDEESPLLGKNRSKCVM
ncbi:hypothetical protein OROMI_018566 [Orobanche minor]